MDKKIREALKGMFRKGVSEEVMAQARNLINEAMSTGEFTFTEEAVREHSPLYCALRAELLERDWRSFPMLGNRYVTPQKYAVLSQLQKTLVPRSDTYRVHIKGGTFYPHDITMRRGGKSPPVRFPIGSLIRYKNQVCMVVCLYRTVKNPREWIYRFVDKGTRDMENILSWMCEAKHTMTHDLFMNEYDAIEYYGVFQRFSNAHVAINSDLVRGATLLSSGEVISMVIEERATNHPQVIIDSTAEPSTPELPTRIFNQLPDSND